MPREETAQTVDRRAPAGAAIPTRTSSFPSCHDGFCTTEICYMHVTIKVVRILCKKLKILRD